jgi:hypothetical protein
MSQFFEARRAERKQEAELIEKQKRGDAEPEEVVGMQWLYIYLCIHVCVCACVCVCVCVCV